MGTDDGNLGKLFKGSYGRMEELRLKRYLTFQEWLIKRTEKCFNLISRGEVNLINSP